MALPRRNLTISFEKTISTATGLPETIVVAVVPLSTTTSPESQVAYAGGVQEQEITLSQDTNNVVFEILPSDHPSLTERVIYRVGWRSKFRGRASSYDIIMPDVDINFADLDDLGAVLGGDVFLRQTDRGRFGGVAALNDAGQVVDAFGNVVSGEGSAQTVQNNLNAEIVARQQGDVAVRNNLESQLASQISSVLSTTASNLSLAVSNLQSADVTEANVRANAVAALNSGLQALQIQHNNDIDILENDLATQSATILSKADLVGGKLAVAQLPDLAICKAVDVADQTAMLALTTTQVQQGDLAVRPDGVWMFNGTNPATLSQWKRITSVMSVNGQTGIITLTAANVGARSSSAPVPLADVDGLSAALAGKAAASALATLTSRVTSIENDGSIVRLNGDGRINSTLLDNGVAYLNSSNQITKKDGTVIAVTGGGAVASVNGKTGTVVLTAADIGARASSDPVPVSDVSGLTAVLASKVDTSDARLANARTPTPHAASHQTGGSDALFPVAQSDVTGLVAALASKAAASTVTTQGNRISGLETRVTDLEAGGGGPGGGGSSAKTTWWEGTLTEDVTDVSDFKDIANILLKSPWGKASDGTFYYDPAGAADGEQVYPYISANGHLQLRVWNESGAADPVYALAADLTALGVQVNLKASQTDLNTTNATVATKASQSALDATNATVALKANQSSLDTTNNNVATKASQSALDATNNTVATKASQASVDSLTATVGGHTTTLATKADLVGGKLKSDQIPTGIPQANVTNLTTTLAAKADLVGGVLKSDQIPSAIPQANIAGLATTLSAKADLVGGVLATSQIPALARHDVVSVGSRAEMLSLTSAQVQPGDECIITSGADQGIYILTAADPSTFSNWLKAPSGTGNVQSVNGQTGIVVLSAANVGARSSSDPIAQADVTGLVSALASKADAAATSAELATKTSTADVRTILTTSTMNKLRVNYVAVGAVASLTGSGVRTIDGTPVTTGMRVLLTAQTASTQNGIWIVASGSWTRASDMASGSYAVQGSEVIVQSGTTYANTLWQQNSSSGVVDQAGMNITYQHIGYVAPPPVYTNGNGLNLTSNQFSVRAHTGISVSSSGVAIDPSLTSRRFAAFVPTGSLTPTITHGLGTQDVSVTVREVSSGQIVFVPANVASNGNDVSLEFGTMPAANQFRILVTC